MVWALLILFKKKNKTTKNKTKNQTCNSRYIFCFCFSSVMNVVMWNTQDRQTVLEQRHRNQRAQRKVLNIIYYGQEEKKNNYVRKNCIVFILSWNDHDYSETCWMEWLLLFLAGFLFHSLIRLFNIFTAGTTDMNDNGNKDDVRVKKIHSNVIIISHCIFFF